MLLLLLLQAANKMIKRLQLIPTETDESAHNIDEDDLAQVNRQIVIKIVLVIHRVFQEKFIELNYAQKIKQFYKMLYILEKPSLIGTFMFQIFKNDYFNNYFKNFKIQIARLVIIVEKLYAYCQNRHKLQFLDI